MLPLGNVENTEEKPATFYALISSAKNPLELTVFLKIGIEKITVVAAPDLCAADTPAEPLPSPLNVSNTVPAPAADLTLRINVSLLDTLMNLAGEMVLGRNQLLQAIGRADANAIKAAGYRINTVTSELQEAIMLTRMQPIGTIFNRFTRVVRDMARDLNKEINLTSTGYRGCIGQTHYFRPPFFRHYS